MSEPTSPPNVPWPERSADPRPRRRRFSLKSMHSLFLLVLLIAVLLGGWGEWRRRLAVSQLIRELSRSQGNIIIYSVRPEVLGPQIRRIRALHGEQLAVDSVIQTLHDARQSHDYSTAQIAITCLLQMEPESIRAVPELISLVTDEDLSDQPGHRWPLKHAALKALGRFGRDDETGTVVAALRKVLGNPLTGRMDPIVEDSVEALGEIGPLAGPAVPDLTRLVSHSNPRIRLAAVVALGRIGPSATPATPAVLAALKDPDDRVRVQGVISLGEIAHADQRMPEIIAAVQELARNDAEVRGVAELALRRLHWKQQLAENRASLLPQLAPEARKRFLEMISEEEARQSRRHLR
jgi:HEAT repeat protein